MNPYSLPRRARPFVHPLDCPCPSCNPPAPSAPRLALALDRLPLRVPVLFAGGMATGAGIVALTGNLGAALRALVGL